MKVKQAGKRWTKYPAGLQIAQQTGRDGSLWKSKPTLVLHFCFPCNDMTKVESCKRNSSEEKTQHVCSCCDLIHRFFLFKVFYISCASCQLCRYRCPSFSKGSQTSEHELFLDPKIFEKGQSDFSILQMDFDPAASFLANSWFCLSCSTWPLWSLSLQTRAARTVEIWNQKQCPLHTAGRRSWITTPYDPMPCQNLIQNSSSSPKVMWNRTWRQISHQVSVMWR